MWFTLEVKVYKIGLEMCKLVKQSWFSLYATLSIYCIVITSDKKKSKIEVSTDWYIAVEY